jgi:hypothetical protein
MSSKLKIRAGDVVYHRSRDLGQGRVRYSYHEFVLVDFEKAPLQRYPKNQLCKNSASLKSVPSVREDNSAS